MRQTLTIGASATPPARWKWYIIFRETIFEQFKPNEHFTSLFRTWDISLIIALGYSRQHLTFYLFNYLSIINYTINYLTIYLQHTSANHLFFQVMNKHCNMEREQLLIILVEEMAKVTASSDQVKPCNISTRFSMQSNFSRLTNESLFCDRRVAEHSAFNWCALLLQNILSPSGLTRAMGYSIARKELKNANLAPHSN